MAVGDIHLSRLKAKPTQITPGSFSSGVFHIPDGVKVPSIYPTSDSTDSIQIRKADNTTTVLGVDTTNTRVGVGGTPIYDFHIVRPSGTYQYSIIDSYNDETQGPTVGGRSARGNFTTPTATAVDDSILRITGSGYYTDDLASFTTSRARISFHAAENFTSTKHGTYISAFTTVIGTTTTSERMRITDVGSIGINTTIPRKKLDILDSSSHQLRLTHTDNSVYTDFQTSSGGDLTITPSGGDLVVSGNISASNISSTSGANRIPIADGEGKLNSWVSIAGPTGPTGGIGSAGTQGTQGNQGYQGYLGTTGPTGSQGNQGNQGNAGTQGTQGNQGFLGSTGATGTQGTQGNQGNQGFLGSTGPTGSQGNQGTQGTQGTQGNQGNQGFLGITGPTGTSGSGGSEYVKSSTTTLSIEEVSSTSINNYGQTTEMTLTLPLASTMYSFVFSVSTIGHPVHIKSNASDTIYLNGTSLDLGGESKISLFNPLIGNSISFTSFKSGGSTYDWICKVISGDWVNGGDYSLIPDCELWLDAAQGITEASGLVSSWADQSGNSRDVIQSTEAYRPEYVESVSMITNEWDAGFTTSSYTGTKPSGRYRHCSVVYNSTDWYIFGGVTSGGVSDRELYKFDLSTLTWTSPVTVTGTKPIARGSHTMVIYSTYIYIFGGISSPCLQDTHRFDITNSSWSGEITTSGTKPAIRESHGAVVSGDYMYVFGGRNLNIATHYNDLHRLDLTNNTWSGALSPTGTPPSVRHKFAYCLYNGYLYIYGGYNGTNYLYDLHRLNLSTLEWSGELTTTNLKYSSYGRLSYLSGSNWYLSYEGRLDLSTLSWNNKLVSIDSSSSRPQYFDAVLALSGNYMYAFGGGSVPTTVSSSFCRLNLQDVTITHDFPGVFFNYKRRLSNSSVSGLSGLTGYTLCVALFLSGDCNYNQYQYPIFLWSGSYMSAGFYFYIDSLLLVTSEVDMYCSSPTSSYSGHAEYLTLNLREPQIWILRWDGSLPDKDLKSSIYFNGLKLFFHSETSIYPSVLNSITDISVGTDNLLTTSYAGYVSEVLFWSRSLADEELNQVNTLLSQKYEITNTYMIK